MPEPLPFLTDSALLHLYHQGDQRAFEQLVERYHTPLCCFLMGILRDRDTTDDVMQHVWIQCALASTPCQEGSAASLRGWLFHVARNRAIDLLRRHAREKMRTTHLATIAPDADDDLSGFLWLHDSQPGPEALAEQRELHQALLSAVVTLPQIYQQIVYFRLWYQLSYKHIGQHLGIPTVTVKTYFYRSRLRLSRTLANWMETGALPEKR